MAEATLIASLGGPLTPEGDELRRLPREAAWLEVRADLVGDLDPEWLRGRFPGKLLYTLRSEREGGCFSGGAEERSRRLRAAGGYDACDLEGMTDLGSETLAAVAAEKRIISWHGPPQELEELRAIFARISAVPGRFYKLVPEAREPGDELAPLALLASLRRPDVVAFASGPAGAWTRLLAPRLGAPLVFGAATSAPAAPGQPTLARLIEDFGLPRLAPVEAVCGVVGNPVAHSLSPRLHNALYRALDLPFLYLPFWTESFGDFWLEVVEGGALEVFGLPWRGLSVTAPFKEAALAVAGASSPLAEKIGAANTLLRSGEVWEAETTDPEGILGPLAVRGFELSGKTAAVLGCGGAGRAAAIGLHQAGAEVSLVYRSEERGRRTGVALDLPVVPWHELRPGEYDVVVNATPVGRENGSEPPVDPALLRRGAAVLDMAYGDGPTALIEEARRRGLLAIDGREILLFQALGQFRMMTGHSAPWEVARRALGFRETAG